MATGRIILHVDFDAFYASIEKQRNPALKGKPVVVGADPKQGKGRGVVVACSYEAREYGVRSAMPISNAYRICPNAIFLRPDFSLYEEVSIRVMALLKRFADRFEQAGLDEAFLDITRVVGDYEDAGKLAHQIKNEICSKENLTCSIGISSSKSTAKIASDYRKPDGLTLVRPAEVKQFLAPLPVSVIPGVGKKTNELLRSRQIVSIGQLQVIPRIKLVEWLGKGGLWLWDVGNGEERGEVKERALKSLSTEHTYEEDVSDRAVIEQTIELLSAELAKRVKEDRLLFKTVGVKVRFSDFDTYTREITVTNPCNDSATIFRMARTLFEEFKEDEREIRLIGVRVTNLSNIETQASLEQWIHSDKESA